MPELPQLVYANQTETHHRCCSPAIFLGVDVDEYEECEWHVLTYEEGQKAEPYKVDL